MTPRPTGPGAAAPPGVCRADPGAAVGEEARFFLQVDGRRLECRWIGPGPEATPTLVFLHHGLGSLSAWRSFPEALAAATGWGALIYSRVGYGASERRPGPWPVRFMHHEAQGVLPRLLAAVGVREAVLVGHSDGASIALLYAGDAASAQGRLRGLVLEAPHLFVEETCVRTIADLRRTEPGSELRRKLARHHGSNAEPTFDAWTEIWLRPEFRRWNIEQVLPGITCPILVFQGDADEFGTVRQAEAIEAGAGGPVETVILPGCGHQPHRQCRHEVLQRIARFVAGLS